MRTKIIKISRKVRLWILINKHKIKNHLKKFNSAFKRESRETIIAAKILKKIIMKKEPTKEEISFLKSQSADIGKAAALIGLQLVPGSSIGIIALEKALKKYGMTIFPKSQGK